MSASSRTSGLAQDPANVTYDPRGSHLSLWRHCQDGTLIDNLTHSYAPSSNGLNAVNDVISGNPEPWDARTGNFTYDANGNLKTAPGPYSISTVTYDYQNLPLSLTRSGVVTTYRYDEAGQRLAKQVGSGNREMYVQEGARALAVVTVNSSGTE